jgi:hypothetical protein
LGVLPGSPPHPLGVAGISTQDIARGPDAISDKGRHFSACDAAGARLVGLGGGRRLWRTSVLLGGRFGNGSFPPVLTFIPSRTRVWCGGNTGSRDEKSLFTLTCWRSPIPPDAGKPAVTACVSIRSFDRSTASLFTESFPLAGL